MQRFIFYFFKLKTIQNYSARQHPYCIVYIYRPLYLCLYVVLWYIFFITYKYGYMQKLALISVHSINGFNDSCFIICVSKCVAVITYILYIQPNIHEFMLTVFNIYALWFI